MSLIADAYAFGCKESSSLFTVLLEFAIVEFALVSGCVTAKMMKIVT